MPPKRQGDGGSNGRRSKKPKLDYQAEFSNNYAQWFNAQTFEFITGKTPRHVEDLEDGWVSVNGSYTVQADDALRDPVHKELSTGSYWTAREKDLFFTFLARKTRHNLLAVAEAIGTKSLVEVEEYHDLLFTHSARKCLIDMESMPVAREMSSEFVEMETAQGVSIVEWEVKKDFRNIRMVHQQQPGWRDDDQQSPFVENTAVTSQLNYRQQMIRQPGTFEAESTNTNSLINVVSLIQLSDRFYQKALFDDTIHDYETRPGLQFVLREFVDELEQTVANVTRKLMADLMAKAYSRKDMVQSVFITQADVRDVTKHWEMDDSVLEYWINMFERINLSMYKSTERGNRAFIRPDSAKHLITRVKRVFGRVYKGSHDHEIEEEGDENQEEERETSDEELTQRVHGSDSEHESENEEEPPREFTENRELELCCLEEEKLDQMDMHQSQVEEHAILTFLNTKGEVELYNDDKTEQIRQKYANRCETNNPKMQTQKWQEQATPTLAVDESDKSDESELEPLKYEEVQLKAWNKMFDRSGFSIFTS